MLGTGARTLLPDIPGLDKPGVFDFAGLVEEMDYEPNRCVIIGGSKVAVEYGSFFQAAGCQTTIVTRSPLMRTASLHHVDEDLRTYVVDGMRKRGMTILEGAHPVEVVGNGRVTGVVVRLADGSTTTLETDFVFIGTGERAVSAPYVEALGIEVDDRGSIVVDKRMRTSVPGVYAIGDLIGPPMEMFKARKCGMTAARNIMGEPYEFDFSEYPDFLHTTYEVTWVGLSEAEAREKYDDVTVIQIHHAVEQRGLPGLERHHLLLDGVLGDQPVDHHLLGLADAVHPVDGLRLGGRVPPRVEQDAVVGLGQVQAEPAGLEADQEDRAPCRS